MATTILDAPNTSMNRLAEPDAAAHDWCRFGVSEGLTVLDPFCSTGTTLVECKKHGIGSFDIEAHPMTAFASTQNILATRSSVSTYSARALQRPHESNSARKSWSFVGRDSRRAERTIA